MNESQLSRSDRLWARIQRRDEIVSAALNGSLTAVLGAGAIGLSMEGSKPLALLGLELAVAASLAAQQTITEVTSLTPLLKSQSELDNRGNL